MTACVANPPEIRLSYLDHPFWRGECLRISLTMAQIPFKDDRLDWNSLCNKGWYPGCMPVLEVNGQFVGMDPQIATYIGKLTGMYPTDPTGVQAFELVLQVLTSITDVLTGVRESNPQRKIQIRAEMVGRNGQVTQALARLEQMLQNNAAGVLAGSSLTVADLASWRAVGWLSSGVLDGVPVDYVAKTFPALMQHHLRVDELPQVQQWVAGNRNYRR
jgi:glutathione S-transferase